MIEITKSFTFDCAHRLTGHEGKCNNLHGHTYQLEVTIASNELVDDGSSEGMVSDFSDLKKLINYFIIDKYDHALVVWEHGDEIDKQLIKMPLQLVKLEERPTAENMIKHMYHLIKEPVKVSTSGKAWVSELKLWETPTSCVVLRGTADE